MHVLRDSPGIDAEMLVMDWERRVCIVLALQQSRAHSSCLLLPTTVHGCGHCGTISWVRRGAGRSKMHVVHPADLRNQCIAQLYLFIHRDNFNCIQHQLLVAIFPTAKRPSIPLNIA